MNLFGMVTTRVSWEYTSYALKSFFRKTKLEESDKFLLIDNDGSFEEDAAWFSPQLEIVRNRAPLSMGTNYNQLIKIAAGGKSDLYLLHNDVIFTDEWREPMMQIERSIVSPLSNQNIQYEVKGVPWASSLKLNAYLGKESNLREVVRQHKEKGGALKKELSTPFFAVKLPRVVYESLGYLDEELEPGAGQDADYCLRAYCEGFDVCFAEQSFVLHFGGRSGDVGKELGSEKERRIQDSRALFESRWGESLRRLILDDDSTVLESDTRLQELNGARDFKDLIENLKR